MSNSILIGLAIWLGFACQRQAEPTAITVTSPDSLFQQMEKGEKQVDFHGLFTEPFREVFLIDKELLLIDYEERLSYALPKPFDPSKVEQHFSFGDSLKITILQEPGSDGMSDRIFPYTLRWEDPHYPHLGGGDTLRMKDWSKYERSIPAYYICYEGGENARLGLSIAFSDDGTALYAQYKGQGESIALKKMEETMSTEGAYPVIETTYQERIDGKINGIYVLTHSGNWDYARYIRGRDNKEFSFTINHDLSIQNHSYRQSPCYE